MLTAPRPVEGMVLAIQAAAESHQKDIADVFATTDDALLKAVQIVKERNLLSHTASVLSVSFSPDSKTIASGSHDSTVRLWQANWQGWLKLACRQLHEHSVLRHPEQSFDPAAATAARGICEREGEFAP